MKKKVFLKRIFHRGSRRIALFFDFDESIKSIVMNLQGATWSRTHGCYHVDDSEENLKLILKTLKRISFVDISGLTNRHADHESLKIIPAGRVPDKIPEILLSVKKDTDDDDYRDIPIPRTIRNVVDDKGSKKELPLNTESRHRSVELGISEKDGLLIIKFHCWYEPEWIEEMRSYGNVRYDRKMKAFLMQWSKMMCDSLTDYFECQGISVKIKKQVAADSLLSERKAACYEIRSRSLGNKAIVGISSLSVHLSENRYSPRTSDSYLAMLEFFFRYFSSKDPGDITEEDISYFIHDFIIRLGYSAAYQNQMISAIKTYYTISGRGKVDPRYFERPRRTRTLPRVFSKEEVSRLLNSAGNIKHKLLLWIIYSCGLRRTEVTNIRINDLDRDRSIIHIREGKGMVDRIVPVPGKVWDKIDEYSSAYRPRVYLFEGQTGGRYSSESVYRVFKIALARAGIEKEVGVHSLRHSYATHLHENGLDIKYIQELLGHRSTKTTEIYTRVSRRNLVAVRSPIEDLDVK